MLYNRHEVICMQYWEVGGRNNSRGTIAACQAASIPFRWLGEEQNMCLVPDAYFIMKKHIIKALLHRTLVAVFLVHGLHRKAYLRLCHMSGTPYNHFGDEVFRWRSCSLLNHFFKALAICLFFPWKLKCETITAFNGIKSEYCLRLFNC